MAKKLKITRDEQEKADKEKMQKRIETLLPTKADIPASISIEQEEGLKSRVRELEAKLAEQQSAGNQVQSTKSVRPLSAEISQENRGETERAYGVAERQKQIALWVAGIFSAVGLIFFSFSIYTLLVSQGGQADLSDIALMPLTILMVIVNLISLRLIRRDRFALGGWLMYLIDAILPPILAALSTANIYVLVGGYFIIFSLLFINLVIPRASMWKAIIVAAGTALALVAIEMWDPGFRMSTNHMETFTPVVMVLTLLAIFAFFIRQAISGNIRTKLITAFVIVASLSIIIVAFLTDRSLRGKLTENIVDNQVSLASSQGFQIGQAIIGQFDKLKGLATLKTIQVGAETAGLEEARPKDVAEIEQLNLAWRATVAAKNTADPLAIKLLYNPLSTQLRNFQKTFPENVEVLLTDQKGFSIASTNLPTNYYQADSLWWRTAHTTGQYVGQPTFNPATNSIALDIAVPVYSYTNNEFVGVLRTTVNFSVLTDLLIEGFRGQTGYSIIYQPNDQEIKLQSLGDGTYKIIQDFASTELQNFAKSSNTSMELSLEGLPVLISSAPVSSYSNSTSGEGATALDGLDWRVIVVQEKSEALQAINAQTRNNLILVSLVSFVVIIIAYFLARFITNPIIHLNAVAKQIASGDLTAEAKVETRDEVGTLAATFNNMTSQLRSLFGSLEQRVVDRTHDLELAAEVGRAVAEKVGNLSVMLTDATEMIRARFNLYYTQVYLLDPSGQTITLRAGTGTAGQELLRRGHHLLVSSSSLNGRAVAEKKPVIVADTGQSGTFLPNPLLPNTRSEMAIPLLVGNKVLGVLDMQSEFANALNEDNLAAFQVLAGQLSVAIQNASLFAQSEEARKQMEENVRHVATTGWKDFLNGSDRGEKIGYVFDQTEVKPLGRKSKAPSENSLSIPITVTGATVGKIQVSQDERKWTSDEAQILQSTAAQLAQHIENLRLLSEAERYRMEAEQTTRRLTREGWDGYLQTRNALAEGYSFSPNEVLSENGAMDESAATISLPITVRNETIGAFVINTDHAAHESMHELFSAVVTQLGDHIENLRLSEQNEKRAYELATVATVSTTASTVLDPEKLLQAVVDLTKERFNVYHAHIYLAEEKGNTLLLTAGAGDVGRQMANMGHSIAMNAERSLVARASRERRSIIVNNVQSEAGYLPNPMLPGTRSEMAVPMISGEKVIGVFDIQASTVGHFTEEDVNIYTTLASQVAVALQNARLYVEQAAAVTQLRELDRLKSSFLANMSHELRTPLNSILGFADVMLEGLDGPLTNNMSNDLGLIHKNGQHLLHLINDVLDMAKIDSGKMNLNVEKFNVHELLSDVADITSLLAKEKSLNLVIESDSDREVEINADKIRLRQVMINLVNNALKFTDEGRVSIRAHCEGKNVLISIKDTGIGISSDHLETVFQEFTQVDTTTTRKTGGTGLGLPISRRLISMHSGRLWAESTGVNGEGSTFHVSLPIEANINEDATLMTAN